MRAGSSNNRPRHSKLALVASLSGLLLSASVTLAGPVQLHTFKTHSRLVFNVDESVSTEWKETAKGFELFFKGIGLADLGAPLGNEEQWAQELQSMSQDGRVQGLQFQEVSGGLKVSGQWKFASGMNAPANPKMERFDYRTKTPPAYVVDFWAKSGPTLAELKGLQSRAVKTAGVKKSQDEAKRLRDRRIASEKARAEADDVSKFCRFPLAEDKDVFLPFSPAHEKLNLSRYISTTTADSNYRYLKPKGDEKDAQYVRLALELYKQGKPALTLKTLDFFDAEHPESVYRHEMRFLRGNAMIKLNMPDEALRIFQKITVDAPESPVALHAGMYLAQKYVEKNSHLAALESFLWLINHHPQNNLIWVFHLGAAEALYALKQTERAAKEYQWVAMNAPERKAQAEAALRMGDLYLERLQYEQALASYFQGINHFAPEAKEFPLIHLNRAESLYWLGQYDRAQESFQKFQEQYPSHPAGWRASFRLGEIAGRKPGPAADADSRKWFYETINRYPYSPGATLARARLLPCGDHGGFDLDAAERFYSTEAMSFDGGGEVVMGKYRDFRGLSHVRSLITFKSEDKAVAVAIAELQANAQSAARHIVRDALVTLFRKSILTMLRDGRKYEALAFYREKSESIPKVKGAAEFVDPDYLLKLSQAASDLNLGGMAQELFSAYSDTVKAQSQTGRSLAAEGSSGKPETEDNDALSRMKASEKYFTSAKALWISAGSRKLTDAEDSKIRELLAKVTEESEFSFEREVILGLMDERANKATSALGHALKAQLLTSNQKSAQQLRLKYWMAGLQTKAGSPKIAIDLYRELESAKPLTESDVLGLANPPSAENLILTEGELLSRQNRWGEAAAAYARAVTGGLGGNQAMYEYARALGRSSGLGDRAKAHATLEKISQSKTDDFWRKLAREALASEQSGAKEGSR